MPRESAEERKRRSGECQRVCVGMIELEGFDRADRGDVRAGDYPRLEAHLCVGGDSRPEPSHASSAEGASRDAQVRVATDTNAAV